MNIFETFIFMLIFLHGACMLFDEFFFHHKRKLPKWERIGHPIDTLFFILCYCIIIFLPISNTTILLYFIFSVLSCLIITKDEFIHLKNCCTYEQYLHAILFVLHPIILIVLFCSWVNFSTTELVIFRQINLPHLKYLIAAQFGLAVIFFFYQIIYWNIIFKDEKNVTKVIN